MADGDVPPSQTIYINRLNEKIKKDGERSLVPPAAAQPPRRFAQRRGRRRARPPIIRPAA